MGYGIWTRDSVLGKERLHHCVAQMPWTWVTESRYQSELNQTEMWYNVTKSGLFVPLSRTHSEFGCTSRLSGRHRLAPPSQNYAGAILLSIPHGNVNGALPYGMVVRGEVQDGKTIVVLQYLALHRG